MWSFSLAAAAAATLLLSLPLTGMASPTPSSLSSSSPIDCSSLSDGFFSNGCSSHFTACSGGRAIPMDCPADLVYDQTRQQCEYPGNVVACGGEAPEEGSGAVEEGSGTEGSGEVDGSGIEGSGTEGTGEIEDISGMCEKRPDGFYRLAECGETFLGCSGGVAWRMACPAHLKYDEKNQQCDYPGNVEGCAEEGSGEIDGSGVEGSGEGSGTDGSGADVTIEEDQTEDVIVSTKNGSTVIDEEDVKEDDLIVDNVLGGQTPEEGSGAVEDGSGTEGSGEMDGSGVEGSGTEGSGEIEDISDMCEKRPDGFYRLAECGESFLGCSGGVAWRMACPAHLKYDEKNQQCDYPGNVEGCAEEGSGEIDGSGVEGSGEGSGTDGSGSEVTIEEDQTEDVIVTSKNGSTVIDEEDVKEDDLIVDNVLSGQTPDEGSGAVEDGSGTEGSGEVDDSGIEGSGTEGSGEIEDISGMCEKRPDGFYRLAECGESFLGCSGGVAWRMACPAHLKYDEKNQQCDYPGNVEGCDESEEGSGEIDGSGSTVIEEDDVKEIEAEDGLIDDNVVVEDKEEVVDEEVVDEDTEAPTTEYSVSSSTLAPTTEAAPVADDVVVEAATAAAKHAIKGHRKSRDDLVDKKIVVEEKKEVVDEKTEATENNVSASTQHDTADEETPSCVGRPDGFYAVGCSSNMLACSNGILSMMVCPAGLVFDERNQMCDHAVHVAGCSAHDDLLSEDVLLTTDNGDSNPEIPRTGDSQVADATRAPTTEAGPIADDVVVEAATAAAKHAIKGPRKSRNNLVDKKVVVEEKTEAPITENNVSSSTQLDNADEETPSCEGRPDGFYAVGCSSNMLACSNGVLSMMTCPAGLVFDERNQICDHSVHVAGCSARDDLLSDDSLLTTDNGDSKPQIPRTRDSDLATLAPTMESRPVADDIIDEDVQMKKEIDDKADLSKPMDHSFACDFSGARAETECSDWFTLCEAGRGIELYCLQGFLFDGAAAKCVPAGQLTRCKAH